MSTFSILIADDHSLLRDTLVHYLANDSDLRVESVGSFDAALALVQGGARYDVVLLDVVMPGMAGIDSVVQMLAANTGGTVMLMSGQTPRDLIEAAMRAGAKGFIPKSMPARTVHQALREAIAGRVYLPPDLYSDLSRGVPPALAHLTPQEIRVLRHLCEGHSNKHIAHAMQLTEITIKTHMRAICTKLDARNRTHAALIGSAHFQT